MSDLILLTFSEEHADEFQVEGFAILERIKWESYCEKIKDYPFPQEVYFGTNEVIEFSSPNNYINSFEVIAIDEKQAEFLEKLFCLDLENGRNYFGIIPCDGLSDDDVLEDSDIDLSFAFNDIEFQK